MSRMGVVARHEFTTNARRWEFILVTLGLPLITAAIFLLASVPNYMYLRSRQMEQRTVHVGIVDPSGRLRFPPEFRGIVPPGNGTPELGQVPAGGRRRVPALTLPQVFSFETYASVADGERALLDKKIEYLYAFAPDYDSTGNAELITLRRSPFDVSMRPPMGLVLREQLLAGKVDAPTLERAKVPIIETAVVLDDKGRRVDDPFTDQMKSIILPYAMMALLVMGLLGSSTYILRSLTEEKESRIQEVLLASVRPADLFYGKIVGLGALGLLQVSVWAAIGLPLASRLLARAEVPPQVLALFFVYFILGFLLYAAILAGIGSVGSSEKESNQIFALFVLLFSSPLLFLPILLDAPNGWLPRFFSIFPFTSPLMMVMRLLNAQVSTADLLASLALLLASVLVALRLSLKVFEVGLLLYGKSPTPAEIWRAIRR